MTTGLVVGKFYPFHKGHKYLIETAKSQVDKVTVLVCHKEGQVIPGAERARWIRRDVGGVKVMVIPDVLPDEPLPWAKYTLKVLGFIPDFVFTSEDYGEEYARLMGSQHILVDKKRAKIPVSGTKVRKDPYANWQYLTPSARAYFAKKICVVGAESTGTTTMAQALAKYYKTVWVPEYGRFYYEGRMHLANSKWKTDDFEHIAKQQNQFEDKLASISNKIVVCDTDSFATNLWHERYIGKVSKRVARFSKNRHYDLYLVTDDSIPFVQDGTRDGEKIRHQMHERFIEELKKAGKDYIILKGNHKERLNKAISACNEKMLESVFA